MWIEHLTWLLPGTQAGQVSEGPPMVHTTIDPWLRTMLVNFELLERNCW